tara:strand:+ start:68 stop:586 length:519 start_codon:yes stop_codon:yes gene_type:complete
MSKSLKTWFPKKFILYPNEPSIQIDTKEWYQKYNAEVKTHTKTRLEMIFYDSDATLATSGLKAETNKYSITYLPLIDKVNVIMHTPGYLPAGPVSGTCNIKKSSIGSATNSNNSNNTNSTLNNQSSSSSFNSNLNTSTSNSRLNNAKLECEDIGYIKGTEKFADCVMKLIDK